MKKKFLAIALVCALSLMTACSSSGNNTDTGSAETTTDQAVTTDASQVEGSVVNEPAGDEEPEGGFQEYPIWTDAEIGFMNVNGVFFQPVPMSNGNEQYEQFDMHFEADVSALDNDLGIGPGDWIPYLTVHYEIIKDSWDGEVAASGTFMPMSADDGPHYGANISLPDAGSYLVRLTFDNPEENGYLIHLDEETGPGGNLSQYDWPLVLEVEEYEDGATAWEYIPQEW